MPDAPEIQEERRRNDSLVLALMQEINGKIDKIDSRLSAHIADEPVQFKALFDQAFPEGDPDGHRRLHEAEIKRLEDRAQFWHELRNHLAKWGLIGFTGWLLYVAWLAFLKGPK